VSPMRDRDGGDEPTWPDSPRDPERYGRRNLLHCKAVGALANAKAARDQLTMLKRPPKWLVAYLDGIVERLVPVADEMAAHRDEAW
jgi:hypothetical protein